MIQWPAWDSVIPSSVRTVTYLICNSVRTIVDKESKNVSIRHTERSSYSKTTVKPRLTATSSITATFLGLPGKNCHIFSCKSGTRSQSQ